MRRELLALLFVAGCEASAPAPRRHEEPRWAPSSIADHDRELEQKRRREATEEARGQRAQVAAERRSVDEAEWPEPWPAIFLKGEPAPVRTKMEAPAGPSRPWQPRPGAFQGGSAPSTASEEPRGIGRAEVAEFMRRLELLDHDVVEVDRVLKEQAHHATLYWVNERVRTVRDDPVRARRSGVQAPTDAEVQAHYDRELAERRASWIHNDRIRREVDDRMRVLGK
jgi:hypothetical protein